MENIIWIRGAERLLIWLFGGMSIFLGYRLFATYVREKGELAAQMKDWKISLRNLAPGIYFSLFGTVVLAFALNHTYRYDSSEQGGSQYLDRPAVKTEKASAVEMIAAISMAEKYIRKPGPPAELQQLQLTVPALAKVRRFLAESATEVGAVDWYFSQKEAIQKDPSAFNKLSTQQREKYQWLDSMLAD